MKSKNKKNLASFPFLGILVFTFAFLLPKGEVVAQVYSGIRERKIQEVFSRERSQQSRSRFLFSHTSSVLFSEFPFNGLGIRWEGEEPERTSVKIEVKIHDGGWSDWIPLLPIGGDAKEPEDQRIHYTRPIFVEKGVAVQYRVTTSSKRNSVVPTVASVEIIYFDTTGKQRNEERFTRSSQPPLAIVTRQDWGADESWRLTADGQEIWPVQYEPPQKLIIHHTAGGNGGDDSGATIRGIYYWHAVVLGWGDIGYNYLIDHRGTIYEGRIGGDGVVAGHTFDDRSQLNYNKGTMGIAVLGCYESTLDQAGNPRCSNIDTIVPEILMALTDLIAVKGIALKIEPQGSSTFLGTTLPNIIGHRDVDATLCPGSDLYFSLETIRSQAQEKFIAMGGGKKEWDTVLSSHTVKTETTIGDTVPTTVIFTNRGTRTWKKEEVVLRTTGRSNKPSRFLSSDWGNPLGNFKFQEEEVPSEGSGTFSFILTAPSMYGNYEQRFQLFFRDGSDPTVLFQPMPGGKFVLKTTVDSPLKVEFFSHTIPLASLNIWTFPAEIKVRNAGILPWDRSMLLEVFNSEAKQSLFADRSWQHPFGYFQLKEKKVKPGKIGTFRLTLRAPKEPGLYSHLLKLQSKNQRFPIQNGRYILLTRVDTTKSPPIANAVSHRPATIVEHDSN